MDTEAPRPCGAARLEGPMSEPFDHDEYAARVRRHLLSAPTFGQPDDPGVYARSCLRCGLDEGLGENRLCATCCPPAPWWAHVARTVDERALLLRLWRRARRFMARCAGEGM